MTSETRLDQIDIWLAFTDEIKSAQLLDQYRTLLTDQELYQERRFHFSKDQHRYLITRALVRTVLSKYVPVAPKQWQFSSNAFGKPGIANDTARAQEISFNLSHTDCLIALGITRHQSLGVDTEHLRARPAPIEAASHFLSMHEVCALRTRPAAMHHDLFFQYWTLKEAYIKARGMGLSIPLEQFSFHLQHEGQIAVSFDRVLNDCPSRWSFWQYRVSPDLLLSICVERAKDVPQHLNFKQIIPLEGEQPFSCELLRKSISV
jgi:4'-phosphopantetheinyl transferase